MQFDDIGLYLPAYLSADSKNALKDALKSFPKIANDKFYTNYLSDTNTLYQGDCLNGLTLVDIPRQSFKTNKPGIVLSNTCDISGENKRLFNAQLIYAPIVNLKSWVDLLKTQGTDPSVIDSHVQSIKDQTITQIFFLPELPSVIDESIVFLDRLQHIPAASVDQTEIKNRRICTLSDYGHYFFLFKLSIHFTRFQDKVERRSL